MTARARAAAAALLKPKAPKVPVRYQPVPKLWPGETAVILACGPSLCAEDVDYCRGKARVVAINDVVINHENRPALAPWADALWATDGKWWNHHQGVPSFKGLKFGLTVDSRKWPDVHVLRNDGPRGLCMDPTGVRTGSNSSAAALNLAVHLGATSIAFLGLDLGHPPGTPSHFFGEHGSGLRSNSPYPVFIQAFQMMVESLKAAGVTVVNCSRTTNLHCFPRMSIEQFFSDVAGEAVA